MGNLEQIANHNRVGGWLPSKQQAIQNWLRELAAEHENFRQPLHPALRKFQKLIESEPEIFLYFNTMFDQNFKKHPSASSENQTVVKNYKQMLDLINLVLTKAPEFDTIELIGLPINAILSLAMGTPSGFSAFIHSKVNAQLKEILGYWCSFLDSHRSVYVLNTGPKGWMNTVAAQKIKIELFEHDPHAAHWGFLSWNDFFTRKFKSGARPVAEPDNNKIIVSACESTPYRISTDVGEWSTFWIKSQPYSLRFMMNNDEHAASFIGGTVYQAFLDACNYHRWHSPINGTIKKMVIKDGCYYSEAPTETDGPAEPNWPLSYLVQVATRAIIFIECDDPQLGLVCFIAVGMAEVSSTIITVESGQKVRKGEELGYFQYGGSSYCLIFRKGVIKSFTPDAIPNPKNENPVIVQLNSAIAIAN